MKRLLTLILTIFIFVSADAQEELMDIQLETMKGDSITIKDLIIDGNYTILDFWQTGCKPCIVQLNSFNKQLQELDNRNISMYAINTFEKEASINKMKEKFDWNFEIYCDKKGAFYDYFKSDQMVLPMTVILDENLEVVYQANGVKVWKFNDDGELFFNMDVAEEISNYMDKGDWSKLGTPVSDYFEIIDKNRQ
ncbi:peroxiredoxin family protein [Ekhidna sp.]|uniref:peroxiredoxin family protein n=1 Tax=Ekhidna sp. TaxID=2608089 RepID=UPI003B5011A9